MTLSNAPIDQLTREEAAKELAELAKIIAHHDYLYHQKAAPEISDAAYDELVRRNKAIEERFRICIVLIALPIAWEQPLPRDSRR